VRELHRRLTRDDVSYFFEIDPGRHSRRPHRNPGSTGPFGPPRKRWTRAETSKSSNGSTVSGSVRPWGNRRVPGGVWSSTARSDARCGKPPPATPR